LRKILATFSALSVARVNSSEPSDMIPEGDSDDPMNDTVSQLSQQWRDFKWGHRC
jgi:hypothetical protein